MTNFEKYKDKILQTHINFAVNADTGEPTSCGQIKCQGCMFWSTFGNGCAPAKLEWLLEEAD